MPVDSLETLKSDESLIVMPMTKLSEMLAEIREKSKQMRKEKKLDISNQEKLVTELIRIDSDDSDDT